MFTIADNLLAAWNTHRAVQEAEKSPDTERSKEEMENNASNGTTDAQLAEGIKHIELAPGSDGVSGLAAPEAWMAAWRAKRSFKDVKESADAIAEAALVDATPALSLRRVTISNLPEWAKVSDVLSLIHGGDIDKVTIDAAGKAVVLFCDAADCKKYYDQYAEGILIAHDDLVITLELGPEENEMTSTHLAAIKAGATRVVALSGVSLEISSQFIAKALQCEFEVDKIVFRADTDKLGLLHFLFTSIEDAIKFTAILTQNRVEGSNIAYEPDPCKLAPGFHADIPSIHVLSAGAAEA